MTVAPSGDHRLDQHERVHPQVISVLNNLLYEGVRVKSLTYSMLRWVRNRDHFLRRKAAGLPIVEETDFDEINDLRLSVGLHPVRDL